ncbi:MAG: LAGLIDADG family homing endonuclease [Candidatus Omnitrophica bacterium]|nr:LAGLIDADG family homing endonuclease [Candidatus Omnitrophota bacterium]
MSRIILTKGKQKEFLENVNRKNRMNWPYIANLCNVSKRTIRDWRNEKFYMKYESAITLSEKANIPLRKSRRIMPEYWNTKKAASKGGRKRYELYGNPGTSEGRKKGGINSQRKFQENPALWRKLGIKIKENIKKPVNSAKLSEFIGIVLGDGTISDYFVAISFDASSDRKYSHYVKELIKEVFEIPPSTIMRDPLYDNSGRIVVYRKNLVEFLLKKGLKKGDKIRNKTNIPLWINKNRTYKIACTRGLIDTDGSFYTYRHKINKVIYNHFAICFTNYSKPLLDFVYKVFKELKFTPSITKNRIYLHRKKDIKTYVKVFGSNNPKHLQKYEHFLNKFRKDD